MQEPQDTFMASSTSSDKRLRLAVVGVGIAGQSHLLDAVTSPSVEVVAVCSRHKEHALQVASDFGVPTAYNDLARMLAEQRLDAVIVATPIRFLAGHVLTCLNADVDVVAEKPLATGQLDLCHLANAVHKSGHNVVVPYTRRYRKAWATARDWIATGRIGSLIRVQWNWGGPFQERYAPRAPTYRADPFQRVAGVILDSGSHALDGILYLTGELGVVKQAVLEWDAQERVDVAGTIVLHQSRGLDIVLDFHDGGLEEARLVSIEGTEGAIVIDDETAILRSHEGVLQQVIDGYHSRPIDDLLSLRNGKPVCGATIIDASTVVRCLISIYKVADRPLPQPWQRPRAKAWARLSGAC